MKRVPPLDGPIQRRKTSLYCMSLAQNTLDPLRVSRSFSPFSIYTEKKADEVEIILMACIGTMCESWLWVLPVK